MSNVDCTQLLSQGLRTIGLKYAAETATTSLEITSISACALTPEPGAGREGWDTASSSPP
jgi:hypothetical protein